jgi:nitrate/nitrite-specific signal transduction histidine kinase
MNISGLSIKWKLLVPVIIITLVTLTQIYLVQNMNRMQQEDAARVNVAGRQRMLSQKMTKETLNYIYTKDPAHVKAQAETIAAFEKSLQALLKGGQLELSGRMSVLTPTEQKEIVAALKEAEQYWQKVRPFFLGATQPQSSSQQINVAELNGYSMELLKRFDSITGMYETCSTATAKRNMTLMYIGLALLFLAAVAAWFYVQKNFIRPILALRDGAMRIASGDLTR